MVLDELSHAAQQLLSSESEASRVQYGSTGLLPLGGYSFHGPKQLQEQRC